MKSIQELKSEGTDRELHWLVNDIVETELPQIVEALQICSNLITFNTPQKPDLHMERGPSITLPVSSGQLEAVKGTIVRDGLFVTKMSLFIKDKGFKNLSKLALVRPMLLGQLAESQEAIEDALELIVKASSIFDDTPVGGGSPRLHSSAHNELLSIFSELQRKLKTAKTCLQLPTDPRLVFPLNVAKESLFDSKLDNVAIDIYVNQAEVCVDLKDLYRVTDKPWADIDPKTGKSHVDTIRDGISAGAAPPNEKNVQNHVFAGLLKPKFEAHDYITRCVTYNKSVVMVNSKIEVSLADPILVSAFTKLDSLEYMVGRFVDNIKTLME